MSESNDRGTPEQKHLAAKEERRLLSIILRDKQLLMDIIALGFKTGPSGHFWDDKTRFLYEHIYEHYHRNHSLLTRAAMESRLESIFDNEVDVAAGLNFWAEVWSNTEASKEDFDYLKTQINNRYVQWSALNILKQGYENLKDARVDQPDLVRTIQQDILTIDCLQQDSYAKTVRAEEGFRRAMEYVVDRRENPMNQKGVLCGIPSIDRIFNGFGYGTYTVISGMINGGKTTMMLNMANNMSLAGYHVVYVSLEKSADLFYRRLLCLNANCDYNRVKRGGKRDESINDEWFERLQKAEGRLQASKLNLECIQLQPKTKLPAILAKVDKMRMERPIDVLFVDYLGVIGWETNFQGRPDLNVADVHQQVLAYGKQHNLVTIVASQLKNESTRNIRKVAKKALSEGNISAISVNTEDYAETQKIVADADNAISLVLSGEYPQTEIIVHITKARDDSAHQTLKLTFDGGIGLIQDQNISPSEITSVEEVVYDADITEDKLKGELFDGPELQKIFDEETTSTTTKTEIKQETESKLEPEKTEVQKEPQAEVNIEKPKVEKPNIETDIKKSKKSKTLDVLGDIFDE